MVLSDRSPGRILNRVFCLGLEKPATAQTIERIKGIYKEAGSEHFLVHLSPMARPTTLPRLLEEAGLVVGGREAVAVRAATHVKKPDPFFKLIEASASDAEAVAEVLEGIGGLPEAFIDFNRRSIGQPHWHHFLALDGTKPYSLCGVHIKDGHAWMAPAWTLPEYRNRGTHSAMIAHSINLAADQGCDWITTHYPARIEGRTRSYERAGFKLLYLRTLYHPNKGALMPMGVSPRVSEPGK